jgi:hypothetical protein
MEALMKFRLAIAALIAFTLASLLPIAASSNNEPYPPKPVCSFPTLVVHEGKTFMDQLDALYYTALPISPADNICAVVIYDQTFRVFYNGDSGDEAYALFWNPTNVLISKWCHSCQIPTIVDIYTGPASVSYLPIVGR